MIPTPNPTPPKPTGVETEVHLSGALIAFDNGRLVLIQSPGSDAEMLPVFLTKESLEKILGVADVRFDSIKVITDGQEFLEQIPPEIVVAYNPRHMPDGKIRWFALKR